MSLSIDTDSNRVRTAPRLAIVVPCLDEAEALPATNSTLTECMARLSCDALIDTGSYILYVDDGSRDSSWALMKSFADGAANIHAIRLSANVGQQDALMAGLEYVTGSCDAAISIDADLQDDVSVVRKMVEAYLSGCDVVYGVRNDRQTDSWFKRNSAVAFYRTMRSLGVNTIENHSDFRLLSHDALLRLAGYPERNLFLRGIVPMVGGKQETVSYSRKPRMAGHTKYPLLKMVNFAADGITSFSVRPVRFVFILGLLFMIAALGIFIYVMIRYMQGETIEGWTSLMLSIWFCTGTLLLGLGIIGEYVAKIYTEVKHRPRYHISESV